MEEFYKGTSVSLIKRQIEYIEQLIRENKLFVREDYRGKSFQLSIEKQAYVILFNFKILYSTEPRFFDINEKPSNNPNDSYYSKNWKAREESLVQKSLLDFRKLLLLD